MIHYHTTRDRGFCDYLGLLFSFRGSVVFVASKVTIPCSLIAMVLRWLMNQGHISDMKLTHTLKDNVLWSGFSFLVGFLVIFRTSQSYERFDAGCAHLMRMRAEWFDACSALMAFCKHSHSSQEVVLQFQHVCIRLFSMLHGAALAEIEDSNSKEIEDISAFKFPLVDPEGMDPDSLAIIKDSHCKVELLYQWIQQVVVENIKAGVLDIPAPILTRTFQEMGSGMVALSEAIKISSVPLPFPYVQCCDLLLSMHWCLVPIVVTQWTEEPWWAFGFCFIQVFILWSLNYISAEIENPFGSDPNDIDALSMQEEMNSFLTLLLKDSTKRTPRLSEKTQRILQTPGGASIGLKTFRSFTDAWRGLARKNLTGWEQEVRASHMDIESSVVTSGRTSEDRNSFIAVSTGDILYARSARTTVSASRPPRSEDRLKRVIAAFSSVGTKSFKHGRASTQSHGGDGPKKLVIVPSPDWGRDSLCEMSSGTQHSGPTGKQHVEADSSKEHAKPKKKQAHFQVADSPVEEFQESSQQHSPSDDFFHGQPFSSGADAPLEQNAPAQSWFGVPKAPPNPKALGAPPDDEPPLVLSSCDAVQDV